jgi:glucose-fructose oxidoreductase
MVMRTKPGGRRQRAQSARHTGRQTRGATRARGTGRSETADRKIGYAVVGLGHIAQVAVLPAFRHARNAEVIALVSSDAEKRQQLGRKLGVKNLFSYSEIEQCLALPEVDAVYIATPNDKHLEHVLSAARTGTHVLCEKPLASREEDCERMVRACEEAGVKLMTAYRLHFEPANLHVVELVRTGKLGEPKLFSSSFSYQVKPHNIRTQAERGGGVVWDIGIYPVNATRYLFRSEPIEVFAYTTRGKDERFREIEESVTCLMKFPDEQVASFNASFGAAATSSFRLVGTRGDVYLDDAYEYVGGKEMWITIDDRTRQKSFPPVDQFAAELEYFADCIQNGQDPEPDGLEGWMDVRIIEAIYQSARAGRPVSIEPLPRRARPDASQRYEKPPVKEPDLVRVESPSS